jgi:hypothetical protein
VLSRLLRVAGAVADVEGFVVEGFVVEGVAEGLAVASVLPIAAESAVAALSDAVARSPRACPQPIMTAALNVSPAAAIVTRRRLGTRFISFKTPIDRFF